MGGGGAVKSRKKRDKTALSLIKSHPTREDRGGNFCIAIAMLSLAMPSAQVLPRSLRGDTDIPSRTLAVIA